MAVVSFEGLNKGLVLAALYNGAKPTGKYMKEYDPKPMTQNEARELLLSKKQFDYIKGRVLLIIFVDETFNSKLYDKNNGKGTAETIIESLRKTSDENNSQISEFHKIGVEKEIKRIAGAYAIGQK